MTILLRPKQKPDRERLFWVPSWNQAAWLFLGDWQEVHKNINRAFTENTASSGEPNWVVLGIFSFVLAILAVAVYYYYRQTAGAEPTSSASPPKSHASLPTEHRNRQKRNWVRVPAGFDIQYTVLASEPAEPPALQTARLMDISGGGCLLATKSQLRPGEKLKLVLALPQIPEMVVTGRVARSVTHLTDPPVFLTGIEFVNGSHGYRDRINRWVFSQQPQWLNRKHWSSQGLCLLCGNLIPKSDSRGVPYCTHCLIGKDDSSPSEPGSKSIP